MFQNIFFLLVCLFLRSVVEAENYQNSQCLNLVSVEDFHEYAKANIEKNALLYYEDVALTGKTFKGNIEAFSRLLIRPRYMRDTSNMKLATTVLGEQISFPVGISPHGSQCGAHPEGENATAKAAKEAGTVMILSTYSQISLEKVAEAAKGGLRWFHVHIFANRNLTFDLVKRAELAGYKAIVLTIDSADKRYLRDRAHYNYPDTKSLENFDKYLYGNISGINLNEPGSVAIARNISWSDLSWLQTITKLPVVVKGILTAEDALLALRGGAKAILVSNHGGRQLDSACATIEALPAIVKAVQGRMEVYMDGGVRTGVDVFKALALGARAVFYGRPNVYGLSFQGEKGAKCVLDIFRDELETTMTFCGIDDVREIPLRQKDHVIVKEEYYRSLK